MEDLLALHAQHFPQLRQALRNLDDDDLRRKVSGETERHMHAERERIAEGFLAGLARDRGRLERLLTAVQKMSPASPGCSNSSERGRVSNSVSISGSRPCGFIRKNCNQENPLRRLTELVGNLAVRIEANLARFVGSANEQSHALGHRSPIERRGEAEIACATAGGVAGRACKTTIVQCSTPLFDSSNRHFGLMGRPYNGDSREPIVETEKILVVDDEEAIREVVSTLLEAQGYHCTVCSNGRMALDAFRKDTFDLALSDIVMPEMDGLKLLAELRNEDPDVPVIMVTAMHDISIALQAIRAGAYDYILKPFEKDQLHLSVRRALEHRRLVMENRTYQSDLEHLVAERTQQLSIALQDLEQSYDYTLEALGGALDAKDAETEGHCQRVTAFTITIARSMGVDPGALRQIARGAFLHDIGKMGVPDSILRKPGPLTNEEREIMRKHCEIGFSVLERIPFLKEAAEIVLSHQECYDGSGYPRKLKGEQIPLGARIFAVADTLDAMISDRPYRKALPISAARAEIQKFSGKQFDPRVVEVFLSHPDRVWMELHEKIGDPFRMTQMERA
jgi:putative nucleotidyltransferase with HDIG domain